MRYLKLKEYSELRDTADGSFGARVETTNGALLRIVVAIERIAPGARAFWEVVL